MQQAKVDGTTVKVGDYVSFKSDIEQGGNISRIQRSQFTGHIELVLEDEDGFAGDYIGGNTRTTQLASDCWVD